MKYRAEIDGLRAIAVVPVILFHAGFELFSGGFVGVDVFFVISGYLITTILIEDIEDKRFSIINFYERRARRILPALFSVMLFCIPFAWISMFPSQMKDFSQSLAAVSLFSSNILFWRESGYFDAAAEEKPLLHTWSLAVEEQYYVFFPIFLITAWPFGKKWVLRVIVVMAAISFILSEWGWRNNATANFYLAPTRAWELFAGSIVAFIIQKIGVQKSNILAFIGLVAIVFSIYYYNESIPFPSVFALPPVLGVVLIILYADKETVVAKFLGSKIFVGVGLVSYSAYLWHQPLFSFARIKIQSEPSHVLMSALAVSSLALGYLSYRFIERPFRKPENFNRKQIFVFSFLGASTFVLIGVGIHLQNGEVGKFSDIPVFETKSGRLVNTRRCDSKILDNVADCRIFGPGFDPEVLLIGDSHAGAIALSLQKSLEDYGKISAMQITMGGCTPIKNVSINSKHFFNDCIKTNRYVYEELISSFKFVIVMSRWTAHLSGLTGFDNQEGGKEEALFDGSEFNELGYLINGEFGTDKDILLKMYKESLESISNVTTLVLVYPVPEAGWNVPEKILHWLIDNPQLVNDVPESLASTEHSIFIARNSLVYELFDELDFPVIRVKPEDLFCNTFIANRCIAHLNGVPLYYDDDHLSSLGARMLVELIMVKLNDLMD